MNFGRARVFVYQLPVDMRKSFDGLYGLILTSDQNPVSGDVFLFISSDRKRAKALFWDGNGLNIWMKRMEQGRLADVFKRSEMTTRELSLFFEGSLSVVKRLSPQDHSARYTKRDQNNEPRLDV